MRRIAAFAAVLAIAGCSADRVAEPPIAGDAPSSAPQSRTAEPRTQEAARKVAQEEMDTYASGDYGGAWDLWADDAKKLVSREDYERLHELCPPVAEGIQFEIKSVRLAPDGNSAVVRVSRSIALMSFNFVYEAGRWRFVPTKQAQRDYRTKTVQQMAAEKRKIGSCSS